ncbi:MAG TPA: endonuclease/exonuclease/phosphatase family protein [Candidatus Acidoferrales bacterium]|nr:endonuclease/exonuclease/phosphatase family protein [Candidatus Acidoferrales bacterium]
MIGEVIFGVIGLLFLFADVRTFSSTFQQTFFGAPNTNLAIMATAVFATSFLGLILAWRMGPTRALGISAAAFGLTTFLTTASRNNWTDLALVVIALAAGFWWLAFLHAGRTANAPSPLPIALPIAFASDLALRATLRTVAAPDVAWSEALLIGVVGLALFSVSGLVALAPQRQWNVPSARGTLPLLAVPCLILVAETGGTNGAQAALAAGLGLGPEGPRATQVGEIVVGAGLAVGVLALWRLRLAGYVAAIAVAIGAALLWAHLALLSFAGAGVLALGCVLAASAILGAPLQAGAAPKRVVLALSVGWLLFVVTAFGFYAFWAYYPAVWAATAIVALAALASPVPSTRPGLVLTAVAVVLAVAAPFAAYSATPEPDAPLAAKNTFRVMTYNIHQGFDAGQIPSLDALADIITQESPDVLCLQEVVRGWMIDEQQDALSVLAERLHMRYVFLPAIGDLYGDAILSRFDMTDVKRIAYPFEGGKHQPRGAIGVRTSGVTFVCTHLDDVSNASIERQTQIRQILDTWTDAPIVIAGDMNATPESIEIQLFHQSELEDLGASAGETTTMDDPQKRIDYVFGKGVVGGQAHIAANNDLKRLMEASDHRSLVVNVTISK